MSDIKIEFAKILDFYNPDNRQKGFDKLVHQNLKNYFGSSAQVATEFFELSPKWKNPASIFKDAVLKTATNTFSSFNPERPFSYTPRVGSQDLAIKAIIKSAAAGNKKFLLGAKCRFGKTFTSYEAVVALKAKTTLIMTFRPTDTLDAWRSDLNSHQHFAGYHFYAVKDLQSFKNDSGKKVLFLSFQKITQALSRNNSELYEFLKKINFDMLIIDEDQIGAHRQENRLLVSKIAPKFTLVVTGTPELEIISNEFANNFYKFDYIDEQKLKEKYHETGDETLKDYDNMPRLSLYSFNVVNKFANTITEKDGFQLSEFFKVKSDGIFEKVAFIKKLLDYLSLSCEDASIEPDEAFGIFASDRVLNHGLWKLPSIAACKALKSVLNHHFYFKDFYVEVLPESDKSPEKIEKICKKHDRTIWLTVMKNTVGVTVKPWTYTMSLYGSEASSFTTYIQYIFRAGSPGKKEFYSFDFCPSRVLRVVDEFAQAHAASSSSDSYEKALAQVVNYLLVFAYNGSGSWNRLDNSSLFKEMASYTTLRSCRNLLYEEFSLDEFSEELKSVSLSKQEPLISKNESLKKLKKELQKSPTKKSKTPQELDDKKFQEQAFQAFIDIYSWTKYAYGSINNVADLVAKIKSFSQNYQAYFGFSDELVNAMIAVIEGSEKKFGIAIERFKNIPFTFAMEDVPAELTDRMLSKFTEKKDGETICDWSCRGPTLLLRAAVWNPTAKLYARLKEGDLRTKFIVEKELGSHVNIIYGEEMHFDKIIMNPPYDGSLHLKILSEAIKHGTEVVNLSPIRWLQDPLAEYKQGSDWKKFKNIRKKLNALDVVSKSDVFNLFNISNSEEFGIYYITRIGGWKDFEIKNIVKKCYNKVYPNLVKIDYNMKDGYRIRIPIIVNHNHRKGGLNSLGKLLIFKDGLKDNQPWYNFYQKKFME